MIISAPAKGEDITIVLGVNDGRYDPAKHDVISNASCTTNCLATAVKPVVDSLGWVKGFMTTIHSYTNDQNVLDGPHKDPRRARNAATNIIPTSTGAAKALYLTIPEVEGTFDGFALRVPTPTVSMIYLVAQTRKPATRAELIEILRGAAEGELRKYVAYTDEELVSSDFKKNPYSSIIDAKLYNANGDLVQIAAWYDNEWGYSCRLAELTAMVLATIPAAESVVSFRRLEDLDVRGKRVLVREDLNVPMTDGEILDYARIDAAIPTLRWLHERGARTIVLSHLGRPDGKPDPRYSLRPIAQALSDRLDIAVHFAEDCVGDAAESAVAGLHDGDVLLLENVRFHPEEERNDQEFARRLARLGDLYVDDAFATAHRAHASTEGLARLLPNAAGLLDGGRALGARAARPTTRQSLLFARSAARRSKTSSRSWSSSSSSSMLSALAAEWPIRCLRRPESTSGVRCATTISSRRGVCSTFLQRAASSSSFRSTRSSRRVSIARTPRTSFRSFDKLRRYR